MLFIKNKGVNILGRPARVISYSSYHTQRQIHLRWWYEDFTLDKVHTRDTATLALFDGLTHEHLEQNHTHLHYTFPRCKKLSAPLDNLTSQDRVLTIHTTIVSTNTFYTIPKQYNSINTVYISLPPVASATWTCTLCHNHSSPTLNG